MRASQLRFSVLVRGRRCAAAGRNPSALVLALALALLAVGGLAAQTARPLDPPPQVVLPKVPIYLPNGKQLTLEDLKPATPAPAEAPPAAPAKPGAVPAGPADAKNASADAKTVTAVQSAAPLGGFELRNADLLAVIDQLARLAKINYVLDPRVHGGVTLNTYGESKSINPREMLDTILRINGAAMVEMGNVYRIVPMAELARLPIRPESLEKDIPDDERPMLNLIFLKYANVEELGKLATEFLGTDGRAWSYPAANLLLVLDSRRNMRRLMELVAMFDSDTLARQRVRVFEVTNSRPSELSKELENLFKSISLSKDTGSVRFVPVDRVNILIAVAPNPGVFSQVEEWVHKLDIKVKGASGKSDSYVYRLKYGRADLVAGSIMNLYYSMNGGFGGYGMGMGGMGMGGMGMGGGMYGGGMYGSGMYGAGAGMYGSGMGMYGSGGYGAGGVGGGSALMSAPGALGGSGAASAVGANSLGSVSGVGGVASGQGMDQTGSYLGAGMGYAGMMPGSTQFGPRVMPNISDNSLLILATPEQYDSVRKLLQEIDIPPRQVLIEAQILEVTLSGALSSGISAWLQNRGAANPGTVPGSTSSTARQLIGAFDGTTTTLSAGMLVGQSRQLFGLLTAKDTSTRTKVISTPRVIATDSIAASITVGEQVPTLSSQALTGAQSSGSSLFANTISNVSTGTTLSITARINPGGVVTLQIDQQVSSPIAAAAGDAIQSPSFQNRQIKTQVTIEDGDMIAIGGIINETKTEASSGVPFLHNLPFLGSLFGAKSYTKDRTELVVFLTPRVIYDTNGLSEASDDLIRGMKRVQKLIHE